MTTITNTRTRGTFSPPILEAKTWAQTTPLPDGLPLLDFSQAAPSTPPPSALLEVLGEAVKTEANLHLYGPVLGNTVLRDALASKTTALYNGTVQGDQVAMTSGCNQAFAAVVASLTSEGDEVILPTPWYFNHKMWLDMSGVTAVPLDVDATFLPDPAKARALITPKTRAIALVSPNNPTGTEYAPELITAFYDLAREHKIFLILDETYRDFRTADATAHDLFARPDWSDTLIHLYSFSKSFHMAGHRLGAIITSADNLSEIGKFLDTVTICPNGIGQAGALWGLEHLDEWLESERQEILSRGTTVREVFRHLARDGWILHSSGAYFAYVEHPDAAKHTNAAQYILEKTGILMLPATMFRPDGQAGASTQFRIAFANLGSEKIREMGVRLADFSF